MLGKVTRSLWVTEGLGWITTCIVYKEKGFYYYMFHYTSQDGTLIKVGENAKENDRLTLSSAPQYWWFHVAGCSGAHVVVCHDGPQLPKETKRDALVLAVHHSKAQDTKMSCVDMTRVEHVVWVRQAGKVKLTGEVVELTVFMRREKERLDRLKQNSIKV
jgi:predicted ribosome quality control (RQC) complex YloA/Tae2 family protein